MRLFFSTPLWGRTRGGVSFNPNELRRRRGRPLASQTIVKGATIVRPARSFYGVVLSDSDPSAELPREHHPWRDAWTIVKTLAWLALHAVIWLALFAIIAAAALVLIMSRL
jgi:hypothetical protein